MSVRSPELRGPPGLGHPVVLQRRARDLLAQTLAVVIPAALALAITVSFPDASIVVVLAAIVGVLALAALTLSPRLALTSTIVTVYLLILDGPVKLGFGARELTAAVPDLLLGAVCLGAVMRILARDERVRMPPLSAWVLAFVGIVLVEAFNPNSPEILKVLAGFRQQLQWVPFFFLGYALLRSKQRLRMMFLVVGVCAVANAVVSTYQTKLSPSQIVSWGPGYQQLYQPATLGLSSKKGRVYDSVEGAYVRPVGLGSDAGFSGGVGMMGLPFGLALLATWRSRRRWIAAVIVLGSAAGVLTGLGRLQVIGGLLCVAFFVAYASLGGQARRALAAIATVALLALPVGVGYLTLIRAGTFKRYESLQTSSPEELATHKSKAYELIPHELATVPFGVGLGTVGAVGGFNGVDNNQLNGHAVSAETQYNLIVDELGGPGLVLWVALSLYVVALTVRGLTTVRRDSDLTIMLAAAMAPFAAMIITGFSGPFETSAALGPYFWLAIGIAAYWFAGPGRAPASEWQRVDLQRPVPAGAP